MAKEKLNLEKVTLNLHKGDKDALRAMHPDLDYSIVIREIIHAHVTKVQKKVDERIPLGEG